LLTHDLAVLAMTCWTGSIEVEGVVIFFPRSEADRKVAMRRLTRQMRAAVVASS
jgi:hypothetical protein